MSFESFMNWWSYGGDPQQSWLASDDSGQPAGCYQLFLPERENTAMAFGGLVVVPARRRAGAGTVLLSHCTGQARRAGRSRLASTGATRTRVRDNSAGASFAAAVGATTGLAEIVRTQEITADLLGRLAAVRADATRRAAGYELLSWRGPSPAEHAEQVALVSSAMSDAPRDADMEPETWDAARVRESERASVANGQRLYSVAARRQGTSELAALTQLTTYPGTPDWGSQGITVVRPQDRGCRLGVLVKIAMLDLVTAHEPGIRYVLTGNAESNAHLAAINEQLGYQVRDVYRSWELDLASGRWA